MTNELIISDGILTDYNVEKPSQLAACVSIPLDILKAIIAAPVDAITGRTSRLRAENELLKLKAELLQTKASVETAEKTPIRPKGRSRPANSDWLTGKGRWILKEGPLPVTDSVVSRIAWDDRVGYAFGPGREERMEARHIGGEYSPFGPRRRVKSTCDRYIMGEAGRPGHQLDGLARDFISGGSRHATDCTTPEAIK